MPEIPTPFNVDDDGQAYQPLLAALVAANDSEIVESLREQRLFVGVVALLVSKNEDGSEKESEMALAVIEHDGKQVLPVFTSIDALSKWRADARPVAVVAEAAGLQVIADDMAGMLIDSLDDHSAFLGMPLIRALVLGYPVVPFHEDPQVLDALDRAVSVEPAAVTAWMEGDESVDAIVTVLIPDLPIDQARLIAERIAERVAQDEQVRLRVERGIDVQVVAAR
jgi:hypothetical protein